MKDTTRIEFVDPSADPRWERLVSERPSLVFHSPQWIRTLVKTYSFSIEAALLIGDEGPVAGLPFAVINDELGRRVAGLAFCDYCDPVADGNSRINRLLREVIGRYPRHEIKLRFLNAENPHKRLGFELVKTARWHGVDLNGSEEELWRRTKTGFRRSVRAARKNDLRVKELKKKELRNFFEMHLKVRKLRYGLLAQPFRFFKNVWQELVSPGKGSFLGAYDAEGRLLAAHCLLYWGKSLVFKFGASDYRLPESRANHLLHWETIRLGLERGFKLFDLGLSDDDQEGLIRYKLSLGAREKVIRFLQRKVAEQSPEVGAVATVLAEATRLATRPEVPDSLTEKFGDALYRYFA